MIEDIEISIIVPIYNVEKYLDECLNSIYAIKNMKKEVILINDGSTDNSTIIAQKYKNKYSNETILVNQENSGLSSARNRGLEIASGKYISFIDSDDFIEGKKFKELKKILEEDDLDILISNAQYYPNTKKMHRGVYEGIKSGVEILVEMLKKKDYREVVWKNLYKREFLNENGIRFIEGLLHEDTPFMFECLLKAKKVKYEDITFYNYRKREGSIVSTQTEKNIIHGIYGIKLILKNYRQINEQNKILNTYIVSSYYSRAKKIKRNEKEIFRSIYELKKFTLEGWIKLILILFCNVKYKAIEINDKILST